MSGVTQFRYKVSKIIHDICGGIVNQLNLDQSCGYAALGYHKEYIYIETRYIGSVSISLCHKVHSLVIK